MQVTSNGKESNESLKFYVKPKQPVINGVSFSKDSVLSAGSISGKITIEGGNLCDKDKQTLCQIIDKDGNVAASVSEMSVDALKIEFDIPKGLTPNQYNVKITVEGKGTSSDMFEISSSSLMPTPEIKSIDKSEAILTEGAIHGYITIQGDNLLPNPLVELIDSDETPLKASIMKSGKESLTVALPKELKEGSYSLKVTVMDKEATYKEKINIEGSKDKQKDIIEVGIIQTTVPNGSGGVIPVIAMDTEKLKEDIVKDGENGKKVIMMEVADVYNKKIDLNKEFLDILNENKADFVLNADDVKMEIPYKFFGSYKDGVSVSVKNLTQTDEEYKQIVDKYKPKEKKIIGDIINVELVDSNNKQISKFKDKIKLYLKLDKTQIAKINMKKIGIYYFDEAKKIWVSTGSKYNAKEGAITVTLNHLTKFGLFEHSKSFKDIDENYWGFDYIESLAAKDIIAGMTNDDYKPEYSVTRAQFVTLLIKALKLELKNYTGKFNDVKSDEWFASYVETASDSGIIKGYDKNLFKPGEKISREQMAVMLMNAYKYVKGTDENSGIQTEPNFEDLSSISTWAMSSIEDAYKLGFINGVDKTKYKPKLTSTRAQAAAVIYRMLNKIEEE